MPTEGLEPPWPDYKTGTLPLSEIDRINFNIFLFLLLLALTGFEPV